ncbi:MAG: sigma-70 family RNA polymerase sigma factor [Acidobacteria bacterium]|nr:sigma-70 family RNA polymerase sigma factor [Acidobacteriota bacterium]
MSAGESNDLTSLLSAMREGDEEAAAQFVPLVYNELRRLAAHYMMLESPDHTLQATALVHEAYLKLIDQNRVTYQNRAHFFGVAAQLMRRILVDHARARRTVKRGSGKKEQLDERVVVAGESDTDVVALDEALQRLAELDPQQSRIVELRFFAGLSIEDAATALGISASTVKRDWNVAKAWLHRELVKGQ